MRKRDVTNKPWSPPAGARPPSEQGTQKTGSPSEDVPKTEGRVLKESVNTTQRVGERAVSAPEEERVENDRRDTQSSGPRETGGRTRTPPHEVKEEEGHAEEEEEEEDLAAPSDLIMKFLRAVVDRQFPLAHKLCQFILIYEPDHPEATEFLSLIQQRLLEAQEEEESDEEEDGVSDDEEDTCSSPSDDDDDDDDGDDKGDEEDT